MQHLLQMIILLFVLYHLMLMMMLMLVLKTTIMLILLFLLMLILVLMLMLKCKVSEIPDESSQTVDGFWRHCKYHPNISRPAPPQQIDARHCKYHSYICQIFKIHQIVQRVLPHTHQVNFKYYHFSYTKRT